MGNKIRVGLLGCGAIGSYVMEQAAQGNLPGVEVAVICVRSLESKGVQRARQLGISVVLDPILLVSFHLDVVAECASQEAVEEYGEGILRSGMDFVPMSLGALVDMSLLGRLVRAAQENGTKLLIPSGGIGGLDALQAAMIPGLTSVQMITRKPPRAWKNIPAVEALDLDLDSLTEPVLLFDGPARDCVKKYPQNINIAAALSLATLGFDDTRITIYADPTVTANTHEIRSEGPTGRLTLLFENTPVPENPKTTWQACASLAATLYRLAAPFRVGT